MHLKKTLARGEPAETVRTMAAQAWRAAQHPARWWRVVEAPEAARAEAECRMSPRTKMPFLVTDNGSSFLPRHSRSRIDGCYRDVCMRRRAPWQPEF